MEINSIISYDKYLLNLLNNTDINKQFNDEFILNIYITLLSLNNSNYHECIYLEEINIIEDYLRKVNNLKVKIQLKRKDSEIDSLLSTIKDIYHNNKDIIDRYNKEKMDIITLLESKDPKELTTLIDKMTKVKIHSVDKKEHDDTLRSLISFNILNNGYYFKDDVICINQKEHDVITISLDEFYHIFEYLLNIKNYPQTFPNEEVNNLHLNIVTKLIAILNGNEATDMELIPMILTYVTLKNISDYEEINTSDFSIENIRITDLYSLASQNNQDINQNTAKWKKVYISNQYLYNKIKEITLKGNYYFEHDKFILENIVNNTSDFKMSILIDDIKKFLKANLEKLI